MLAMSDLTQVDYGRQLAAGIGERFLEPVKRVGHALVHQLVVGLHAVVLLGGNVCCPSVFEPGAGSPPRKGPWRAMIYELHNTYWEALPVAGQPVYVGGRWWLSRRRLRSVGSRAAVSIKARWAALARPVELLLARAEALLALERELKLAEGLGLPCTQKTSQAGTG